MVEKMKAQMVEDVLRKLTEQKVEQEVEKSPVEEDESATLLDPQTREFIEQKLRDNASSNQSHSTAGGVKTLQKLVPDEAEERIIAVDLDKLTTVNSLAKTAQENI